MERSVCLATAEFSGEAPIGFLRLVFQSKHLQEVFGKRYEFEKSSIEKYLPGYLLDTLREIRTVITPYGSLT